MISINSRGDFAHGVGGGFLSLNNQPLIRGGVMGFMDDDTIAFASGADQIDGEWIASAYDLKTGTTRRLNPDNPTGANSGAAGGGIAAWWWAKSGPNYGLHSTAGLRLPNAGLFAVSPDGAIAYKPDFHADGPSVVRERDGSEWTLTPNHAWNLCLVGARRAAWIDSSDLLLRVANLPTPQTLASKINFPTPFHLNGLWRSL